MHAEASLEHGVITSLKDDYGFLRSNKRQEQVFELEDEGDDNGFEKKGDSLVLKEGEDRRRRRTALVLRECMQSANANAAER